MECQASDQAERCSVTPNPALQGDCFPGSNDPGEANRLIATQQLDNALQSTTLPACFLGSCKGLQAFKDKICKMDHITLPNKLPNAYCR